MESQDTNQGGKRKQGAVAGLPTSSCDLGSFRSNGGAEEGGGEDKGQGPSLWGVHGQGRHMEVEVVCNSSQMILPFAGCMSES